jgi:hypothetical protein
MFEQIFTLPIMIITALGVFAYVLNGRREKDIAYMKAREDFERKMNALRRQERFRQGLNATNDKKDEEPTDNERN